MWRHFPHHSHAICGEISDFYTSVTRRNLKFLHMWRKFRFLHICHVERFEITLHVEKFQKSPYLSCIEIWNFSTWQFFLHRYIGGIGDKYEVCPPHLFNLALPSITEQTSVSVYSSGQNHSVKLFIYLCPMNVVAMNSHISPSHPPQYNSTDIRLIFVHSSNQNSFVTLNMVASGCFPILPDFLRNRF